MDISKVAAKVIGDKKRWRAYRARKEQLPASYRAVLEAVQRYTYYRGPGTADALTSLLEDLIDVFEQAAARGMPVENLVGDDPVEFAEGFIRNYAEGSWLRKEQQRLRSAVQQAEKAEQAEHAEHADRDAPKGTGDDSGDGTPDQSRSDGGAR